MRRTGVTAVTTILASLVVTVSAAHAATSHSFVRHAHGAVAGEAWFNSGTHNVDEPDHGYKGPGPNSFTIKDSMCGDGWGTFVRYRIQGDAPRETPRVACGQGPQERWASIAERAQRTPVTWQGCKFALDRKAEECEAPVYDRVNRADGRCNSAWMTVAHGNRWYKDAFVASLVPTAKARALARFKPEMWNDLRRCLAFANDLQGWQLSSMYKQLACHAQYGVHPELGGDTWDLEAARPNVNWAKALNPRHKCNW